MMLLNIYLLNRVTIVRFRLRFLFTICSLVVAISIGCMSVTAAAADCTVSTSKAKTVQVRVGPGLNRSSVVFLPSGKDFKVLGKATAKDGSKWWKLDKSEVAPKKSLNETWVNQKDVVSKGACDKVVDAKAPPVIPIFVAPPTQQPDSSTSNGQSDTTVPTQGTIALASGYWTLTASDGYQACASSPDQTIPYSPGLEPSVGLMIVSGNRSGFTLSYTDTDIVYKLISSNTYQGVFSYTRDDGTTGSLAITLKAVSSRQLSGVGNAQDNYGDGPCSATFPMSLTHN